MSVWGWTWLDWLAVSLCFLLLIRTLFVSFELMIGRWPREGQPKCLKSSKSQKKPSETGFVWACAPKSDDSFISSIFKWEFGVPPKTDSFLPRVPSYILSLLISGAKPEMVPAIFFSRPLWCCRSFMYIPDDDVFFKATSASNLESLGISYRGYLYFSPWPLKPIWYDP